VVGDAVSDIALLPCRNFRARSQYAKDGEVYCALGIQDEDREAMKRLTRQEIEHLRTWFREEGLTHPAFDAVCLMALETADARAPWWKRLFA
jgi:hypothetical protein